MALNLALHSQFYAINQVEINWRQESSGYSDELGRPEEKAVLIISEEVLIPQFGLQH